jgi:hypothetical protein
VWERQLRFSGSIEANENPAIVWPLNCGTGSTGGHQENRAPRFASSRVSDAAQQESLNAAPTTRAHDDHIDACLASVAHDRLGDGAEGLFRHHRMPRGPIPSSDRLQVLLTRLSLELGDT